MLALFVQPSEQLLHFSVGLSCVVSYPGVWRNCAGPLQRAMPPRWKPAAPWGDAVGMPARAVQLSAESKLVQGK